MSDDKKLPESIDNALKNMTDNPTKLIGQMFSDILTIIASRVRNYAMHKSVPNSISISQFKDDIIEKVSLIDEDKLRIPESQIACQAIEDSTYCLQHQELRSMFSSLIANSCNTDYSELMHPSFSNTLKCMSPYDAALFQRLAIQINESGHTVNSVEYSVFTKDSNDYLLLHECIIYTDDFFSNFTMQSLSISALKQLGIIDYTKSTSANVDKKFTDNDFYKSLKDKYCNSESYPVARYVQAYLTPYGEALATACSVYLPNIE